MTPFFLLGPWMEMRWDVTEKPTHPHVTTYSTRDGWQWGAGSHCSSAHNPLIAYSQAQQRNNNSSIHLQATNHTSYITAHVPPTSLSHSLSQALTTSINVCIYLKIVVSQWSLMVSLNIIFRGQSSLSNMQLVLHCSTFFNHNINPVNVTLIKVI